MIQNGTGSLSALGKSELEDLQDVCKEHKGLNIKKSLKQSLEW